MSMHAFQILILLSRFTSIGKLNLGDQILAIDGKVMLDISHNEAAEIFKEAMDSLLVISDVQHANNHMSLNSVAIYRNDCGC